MNSFSSKAGKRIQLFRQARGMSQEKLAEKIHKTKSAVSKYERGDIAVDLETFCEICRALSVSPSDLLDFADSAEDDNSPSLHEFLYIYNLTGKNGKLTRGLMEIHRKPEIETGSASFFYGVPSFDHPEKCIAFYQGDITRQRIFTNIHLINQKNEAEQVSLCFRANLDNLPFSIGLLSGLSFTALVPVACKAVISTKPLPEDYRMKDLLAFNQVELKKLRSTGILTVKTRRD